MNSIKTNEFIFSPRYSLLRHLTYWGVHIILWTGFWSVMSLWHVNKLLVGQNFVKLLLWMPAFILFTLPITHLIIPRLLLKSKYVLFTIAIVAWGVAGLYINAWNRQFLFIPVQEYLGFEYIHKVIFEATSYLCMTTTAAEAAILVIFKYWSKKQQDWMQAEKEKVTAELRLLKAQVHPHFLFNTLNNIYSFSLQQSLKTPALILKLSSLLSYMLYDCKEDEVSLEKELEIMKNYIDLEKERYGDKIDISVNIEGAIHDREIAPLVLLPFLENAFKHGTSEQLTRPWLSFDLAVTGDTLRCKIINSKNEVVPIHENGIGIDNIRKRLQFLYPGKHTLKLSDEGNFFMVSMELQLATVTSTYRLRTENKTVA
ncbi:MAG TPA: histidine kinase [Chitinophagaceae bacterium]